MLAQWKQERQEVNRESSECGGGRETGCTFPISIKLLRVLEKLKPVKKIAEVEAAIPYKRTARQAHATEYTFTRIFRSTLANE